jgi:hypothetical protein
MTWCRDYRGNAALSNEWAEGGLNRQLLFAGR